MKKRNSLRMLSAGILVVGLGLAPAAGSAGPMTPAAQVAASPKTPVVLVDSATQAPRIIREIEEYAPGAEGGKLQLGPGNAAKVALDYLKKNESRLGLLTSGLKLHRARKVGKFWVATFVQQHQNVPVFGSRIGLVALGDGKVLTVGSNYDKAIRLDVKPTVTFESAVAAAASSLKLKNPTAVRTQMKSLVVLPQPKGQTERHKLAWRFILETKKPNPYFLKDFFVDAHKGTVLRTHDAFRTDDLKARVQGAVWPLHPTDAAEVKPLAGLRIKVQDKKDVTGSQGRAQITGVAAGAHDVTLRLEGPSVVVLRNSGTNHDDGLNNEVKLAGRLSAGVETSLSWEASDEVNVFYHINRIADWFLKTFDFAYEYTWDREGYAKSQIVAQCDCGPGTNGVASYGSLGFGSQSGALWARAADVIYHEFTHNAVQPIFAGWIDPTDDPHCEAYAMDEGFADYFACALTNDPSQGEGVTTPRNLNNTMVYTPGSYALEGHTGGQLISGACWDYRANFANKTEADQIVFAALNILSAWPEPYYFSDPGQSNFLSALRIADGGRHPDWIDAAFARHGLLLAAPAPPAPKVTSMTPAAGQRAYGPTEIVIVFDRAIDELTLAGNIVIEREDFKGRRAITCDFFPDLTTRKKVTIKPRNASGGFAPLGTQTDFHVRLVSGQAKAIKGRNGEKLDGDGDGRPGGDYKAKFWIID